MLPLQPPRSPISPSTSTSPSTRSYSGFGTLPIPSRRKNSHPPPSANACKPPEPPQPPLIPYLFSSLPRLPPDTSYSSHIRTNQTPSPTLPQGCHKGRNWRKITVRTSFSSGRPRLPRGRGFTRGRVFTVRGCGKNRIRADARVRPCGRKKNK
jgi:hypothetical protein